MSAIEPLAEEPYPYGTRALSFLDDSGHTTYVWTEEDDDKWVEAIQELMDKGWQFFLVERRFAGFAEPRLTEIKRAKDALKTRAVQVHSPKIAELLEAGHGAQVAPPEEKVSTRRPTRSAKEAAASETVAHRGLKGG